MWAMACHCTVRELILSLLLAVLVNPLKGSLWGSVDRDVPLCLQHWLKFLQGATRAIRSGLGRGRKGLASGTKFKRAPKNSEIKTNNILMNFF